MTYFVRLGESKDVRRIILEGGKELIECLKGYELILELRDQKKEVIQDIQKVMVDLQALLKQLQDRLPASSLKEVEQYLPKEVPKPVPEKPNKTAKPKAEKQKKESPKPVEKQLDPAELSETQKLNQTLVLIERRLQELR